jgi:hypothetical protein
MDEKPISRPASPPPIIDQADQVQAPRWYQQHPDIMLTLPDLQIVQYIGDTALPRLRKFLMDNDRVLAVCTNILYYIVSPALKTKSRYLKFPSLQSSR